MSMILSFRLTASFEKMYSSVFENLNEVTDTGTEMNRDELPSDALHNFFP